MINTTEVRNFINKTMMFTWILKQPNYTGENRCLPCTILNSLIAIAIASVFSYYNTVAGAITFLLCFVIIYLRGYLVPYTPELTKRYFPSWLLTLFQKGGQNRRARSSEIVPEQFLIKEQILVPYTDQDDLFLSNEFSAQFRDFSTKETSEMVDDDQLRVIFGYENKAVSYSQLDDTVIVCLDGQIVAEWDSDIAFLSDIISGTILSKNTKWKEISIMDRVNILKGIRIFIPVCPKCGHPTTTNIQPVETCCDRYKSVVVGCEQCDEPLISLKGE